MKRLLSGLLAALLLFSLTACGAADLVDISAGIAEALLEEQEPSLEEPEDLPDEEDPAAPEDPAPEDPAPEVSAPEETEPDAAPEEAQPDAAPDSQEAEPVSLPENGSYTTKDDVALYIYTYGHLPDNFITKKEAQNLGWSGGSLEPYAPGMSIGGDRFGNYEGLLPDAGGRRWTECDIDTQGANSRGAKRVVFSNDGLIYYTGDHYASFTLLYGDETDG